MQISYWYLTQIANAIHVYHSNACRQRHSVEKQETTKVSRSNQHRLYSTRSVEFKPVNYFSELWKLHAKEASRTDRRQWRRQGSKGARSFRAQNILEPGHPDALFSSKSWQSSPSKHKGQQRRWDCFTVKIKQIKRSAVRYGKIIIFCSHYYRRKAKQ